MGVVKTAVVKFIRKGAPGKDSVLYSIQLTPASVFADANDATKTAKIEAVAYKHVGNEKTIATGGTMFLRYTKADGTTGRVTSTGLVTNGVLSYTSVVFEYQIGQDIVAQQALQINRQGGKGEQGAVLRGPQAWSDCAVGYGFQAGGEGEAWKDVVLYNGNYYSCVKSHTKTASNYPGSTTANNNGYWQLGDKIELVATKILLATYALVQNLGVECIDMKDAKGNVLFRAKDGNVTCKTGTFDGITVQNAKIQSGQIAGFQISGNGLTNSPFTNDAYIIFRNDKYGCFSGIGGNVLPATSGSRAVARFENEDTHDQWGLGRNIAMLLSAKNGTYNHAFLGTGNGTLDGWIGGYHYTKFNLTTANTIYDGYTALKDNNRWVIYSSVSGSGITLPTLQQVRNALGIGTSTKFCVEFTIMADLETSNFWVYGRNKLQDSKKATPWNTTNLPVFCHWNNGRWDRLEMGPGDSITVLLIYDPSKTGTYNDFSLQYTARVINRQN